MNNIKNSLLLMLCLLLNTSGIIEGNPALRQLSSTDLFKHVNLPIDSFFDLEELTKINQNIFNDIFGPNRDSVNNMPNMMKLFGAMTLNYMGDTQDSRRYILYHDLLYRTIQHLQKAEFEAALENTLLQKDILIHAYFDQSFSTLYLGNLCYL